MNELASRIAQVIIFIAAVALLLPAPLIFAIAALRAGGRLLSGCIHRRTIRAGRNSARSPFLRLPGELRNKFIGWLLFKMEFQWRQAASRNLASYTLIGRLASKPRLSSTERTIFLPLSRTLTLLAFSSEIRSLRTSRSSSRN
jgi:hypothetical protein